MNIQTLITVSAILIVTNVHAADVDTAVMPEFDCVIEPSEIVDLGTAVPGVLGQD